MGRQTFALFFCNRGFFPESLIAGAREEMAAALEKNGYGHIVLDASATRYGAVESAAEGEIYAKFLEENKGRFDGVIVAGCRFSCRRIPTNWIKWTMPDAATHSAENFPSWTCFTSTG